MCKGCEIFKHALHDWPKYHPGGAYKEIILTILLSIITEVNDRGIALEKIQLVINL